VHSPPRRWYNRIESGSFWKTIGPGWTTSSQHGIMIFLNTSIYQKYTLLFCIQIDYCYCLMNLGYLALNWRARSLILQGLLFSGTTLIISVQYICPTSCIVSGINIFRAKKKNSVCLSYCKSNMAYASHSVDKCCSDFTCPVWQKLCDGRFRFLGCDLNLVSAILQQGLCVYLKTGAMERKFYRLHTSLVTTCGQADVSVTAWFRSLERFVNCSSGS